MMANIQPRRRFLGSKLPLFSEPIITYSGHPLKLSEIKEGCRWVISHRRGDTETLVCGAECAEGQSYCPVHRARAFIKVPTEAA